MKRIKIGARDSALSQKQVEEVCGELYVFYPDLIFDVNLLKTTGDIDQSASLLHKDKTNFFTKEIDDLVLQKRCDVGVHSAKDLPNPLPEGLEIYALTKCVDSSDSLVLMEEESLQTLRKGAKIGTSSIRRIQMIKRVREDLIPIDIRGTIDQRLNLLKEGIVDGVIIAHAALIRLDLLHLNWIPLEGESAPLQGCLAVVGRKDRKDLKDLFRVIHYERGVS